MNSKNAKSRLFAMINSIGAWLLIIIIVLIMSVASDNFLTISNIINVLRQVCVVGICAVGVSFIVLGGGIDLSLGMGATFAGCNAALLITKFDVPMGPAILLSVLLGAAIGFCTGCIVTFWKVPPFIGTLGVQYIIQGLILVTTNSMPVTGLPDAFLFLGRGYIADAIPVPVIIMMGFYIVGAFLLKYTVFGRSVVAIGENIEAASLSGLRVQQTKVLMYVIGGFCASCAGIILTARLSSGQPSSGADLSLQALAAVYIGGTFKGSMLNTLAGALVWGLINNGLNMVGVNAYWQKVVLGAVIIIAVLFDSVRARLSTAK